MTRWQDTHWARLACLASMMWALSWPLAQAQTPQQAQAQSQIQANSTEPGTALEAQSNANANSKADASAPTPPASAFKLDIDAPDRVRQLLTRHLELQRYQALDDLSDDELLRLLDMTRLDAAKLLATMGYFSPTIRVERNTADTNGVRRVAIHVVPGEATRIDQVMISFAGDIASNTQAAAQRQLITDSWLLPARKPFSQSQWDAAKQQALRQLTSLRYPKGRISESLADINAQDHSARLHLTLDSGPAFQLGALEIAGLQRYDAVLAQRLARLPTGSDYDLRELAATQQRLSSSGYFDSAFVRIDPESPATAAKVLVTVREAPLQKITVGVGASTDSGARFSLDHLHHRVPGIGWRALSTLAIDRDNQTIGSELTSTPDADGWRWNTAVQLQNQRIGSFDIGSQRWRAGTAQATQRIDRNYYLQYDRADTATSDSTPATVAESVSANLALTMRHFDALPFPASGWAWGIELGAGTTLGSAQVPYSRVLARWQAFVPLGSTQDATQAPNLRAGRLVMRAQGGAVLAKDGVSLPATQLFLAGGDNSVRGYTLHDIGVTLADGRVSAGRYLGVGSVEWQRPITVNGVLTDWEGAVFVDAGAVADTPATMKAKFGVGAGVHWKTPVGPLQFDLAYGVDTQRFRLHLNIGFVF